ncbi:MAG TPA: FtsX-like permease family protein [Puia sp.]|nr:FtsX-like permease family protein [Puia sp.]
MFRNYFKTAFRNLRANKAYSTIMVAGLAVGIAVCLIIFLFIGYEESFDNFHHNGPRIYRVLTVGPGTPGKPADPLAGVPFPLPTAMENDLKEWTTSGLYMQGNIQAMVLNKAGQPVKKFKVETGFVQVEPSFFSIFDFPWLAGDPAKSLAADDHIVLTRSTAELYFGDWRQAMGQTIKLQDQYLFKVAGIIADPPGNSDFQQMKMIIPYAAQHFEQNHDWWSLDSDHECFVLLPSHVLPSTADKQLAQLARKYQPAGDKNKLVLEPLSDIHFNDKAGNYSGKAITWDRIHSLWLLAGFILLIACVNFVNISTAQAVNRAKEVGVRKVLGSNRGQLRAQFMLEAFLLVMLSVILALVLTSFVLTPVCRMLDMPVSYALVRQWPVVYFLLATTCGVTLLAGFYPALVLSRFNPISALKTKLAERSTSGVNLRRGLVVLQFVIAQALIIGTLLVLRQMNYFTHASMGFDRHALVTVPIPQDSVSLTRMAYVRDQLFKIRGVEKVSFNDNDPATMDNWWTPFKFDHAAENVRFGSIQRWVDENYLSTYGLTLVAGRSLTSNDSIHEFVVNESMVKRLGLSHPQDILNRQVDLWDGAYVGPIVGVVKDFHASSLKDSMAPVLMLKWKPRFSEAAIRLNGNDMTGTIKAVEKLWNVVYPDFVFEYAFVDEKIANFYKDEARLSLFYRVFASIAIFLSCLGLYGLASFMAAQRIKEVGIRKVLGASVANIVFLFSREFVWLIVIAFVIAAPIAWYFVDDWAQQYVFRLPISGWVFVAGGLGALLIALGTVSFQAVRAACVNPVENLRSE